MSDMVRIGLTGRFRVCGGDGSDLTPKGAKSQGLMALLATSPDLCRNRRWLEDKLWSDRGAEQASASLRQALVDVRRALGPHSDLLLADRQKIGLRRDRVTIELTPDDETEFLEGIDVRDPEFESWLRHERHRHLSLSPVPQSRWPERSGPQPDMQPDLRPMPEIRRADRRQVVIVLQKTRTTADGLSLLEDMFIDAAGLSLREALGVTVYTRRQTPEAPNTICVAVQAIASGDGGRFLRVRAVEVDTEQVLWSGRSEALNGLRGPEETRFILFANQVVEVLADAVSLEVGRSGALDSIVLQRLALRKMWTMNAARLVEADTLLGLADEVQPRGLISARRAQVRVMQMVERHQGDVAALKDEAMALCRTAMEREPNNSMVLAVVAYVRCAIDATPVAGADLAQRSVRMNPNNPLAWDSLSYARLHAGQIAEAHEIALRVQRIGSAAPNRFWWDMGLCLTSALVGDDDLALRMAMSSATEAPEFRAAHRYVLALGAAAGQRETAQDAARKLASLEDGFSVERLARDPEYPVGVLRRAGRLKSDRILSLDAD